MDNKEIKDRLQDILDLCQDGALGYTQAAKETADSEIKTIFNRLSQQRKLFIEELKEDARDLGVEPKAEGTISGFFHRNWMDVKSNFQSKESEAVIEEAQRGEKAALEVYNDVIQKETMPGFINEKLKQQRGMIEGAIEQLKEFKMAVK
ncbi:PA2169 family four-helix-bundle protein [Fulvivirga sp. RKSG066]|uniref:ferritin-like domain-containing protein n=1 Tax=Fulvivirga aurantia TaxID=2529383 RepID=UPI0012BC1112|nr:PA2169 family four-helix-bundle protein [Fulvivirga aurantia]MTI20165.1 PA2169 family four-helix-bundle protein [Fulvivirga aurantia]